MSLMFAAFLSEILPTDSCRPPTRRNAGSRPAASTELLMKATNLASGVPGLDSRYVERWHVIQSMARSGGAASPQCPWCRCDRHDAQFGNIRSIQKWRSGVSLAENVRLRVPAKVSERNALSANCLPPPSEW